MGDDEACQRGRVSKLLHPRTGSATPAPRFEKIKNKYQQATSESDMAEGLHLTCLGAAGSNQPRHGTTQTESPAGASKRDPTRGVHIKKQQYTRTPSANPGGEGFQMQVEISGTYGQGPNFMHAIPGVLNARDDKPAISLRSI
ncbi:hypothetical protein MGYG_09127 [Nannizzia gypsea CBS 118893]|uniref:Uncharacterized protein n=1 Tax=Arthroderma gypseum (strain ATCC MYA-4604 / CBS 118893) TaxID=535722 RepID=E4UZI9_ARTGP|nr:hypothetical protein MGYG_09127 [Nannizzia gypsea CBS 118893]EFR03519.1 hypothetical protein MGYG_09127 [Nannizzia gypsea CBS 118893]